jgi:hypothetical protein
VAKLDPVAGPRGPVTFSIESAAKVSLILSFSQARTQLNECRQFDGQ